MRSNLTTGSQWRALVGVGVGYAAATGLIFVLFFVVPYLVFRAL